MLIKAEKIRVFLSDPHVLFREGIHFTLSGEDDFEVTGETTGNEEAYTLIEANPPNIIILSAHDAKGDAFETTRRIRRNMPSVYVILIIDKKEPEKMFLAIRSGASACLTQDTEPEHLLDIVRVVAQGSFPIMEELFTPALASMVLTVFADSANLNEKFDNLMANLTPKETQILTSIAAGNNIEQATAKLDLNEETIRRNVRLILNKLISNDQARAVIKAAQRSLTSVRESKPTEYVTKAEFNEFKEQLMERLKSIVGGLA